ncbi:hydroxypyruvate isomerase family protein [Neobacillus mesonae]|uniref:hydroxypyruvate isomerase family protein n=1 Tax=Neobacillus mesonae TaxID=1193713 RepID=UPI00203DC989|nr:TIM barrel protein [Neobacillus mesonae]MCM3568493.1 TIM barrel protein [Neobacillus mesonae]
MRKKQLATGGSPEIANSLFVLPNLSTIFTEFPFLERFQKAKEHGFSLVECQFPYEYSIEEIQRELKRHELSMVLINLHPGDWKKGDRGLAADPERIPEFRTSVQQGIRYANALKVPRIHCMAGIVSESLDPETAKQVYIENLKYAGTEAAAHGLTILIEPINQGDMPGYFLSDIHQAKAILNAVNLPNVKLQFDFYHIERIHGNALGLFQQYADRVDHVQIADVPGRHEPGTGNMDYQSIFHYLNRTYNGFAGLEYIPLGKSEDSFSWLPMMEHGGR